MVYLLCPLFLGCLLLICFKLTSSQKVNLLQLHIHNLINFITSFTTIAMVIKTIFIAKLLSYYTSITQLLQYICFNIDSAIVYCYNTLINI